jgi:CRISPR type III-A-associated RAMP protein Csm4
MNPAFVVRFRPLGPWRIGESGARDRVDHVFHSDTFFSAVSQAMLRLGLLEDWLSATVAGPPAVRLSSLFPYLEEVHFVPPPKTMWPPPPSAKVRWRNARFVPLAAVRSLVADQPLNDNRFYLDGASGCLLPAEAKFRSGPFRAVLRSHAAVDRVTGNTVEAHETACLEFAAGAGFWGLVSFADDAAELRWLEPVQAALRLLADTGLGGERSLGWGRSADPQFIDGVLPDLILPPQAESCNEAATDSERPEGEPEPPPKPPAETAWWLLSLYSPAAADAVDWQRACYSLVMRGGRIESPVSSGEAKKLVRMVEEGSVLAAASAPGGAALDVAPDGFPHPVFRCGLALAIPVPLRAAERALGAS